MRGQRRCCGAPTRTGEPCRNWPVENGRCRLHAATGDRRPPDNAQPGPDSGGPLPAADPAGRLELLQDAAERRALEAHRAGEDGDNGKLDASFARNARLAATLARARLALTRARAKGGEAGADGAGDEVDETPDYRLPDNKRG